MSKVSIITVNYNQPEVTLELLQSLRDQDYKDLEVIVVDNGSQEDPSEIIGARFAEAKVIRSDHNLGFAGGNNLGIREATADYLFFLNNDTEVPKGTISALVHALDQSPCVGVVSPIINYYDKPAVTQYAGYSAINSLTGRHHAIGHKKILQPRMEVRDTHYAHGAAMMVKREAIEAAGMMPENYFLYYEELDWGTQIKRAGYKIQVEFSVNVLHKESVSTGQASPLKTYFQTRNRLLFMRRNMPFWRQLVFYSFFLLIAFPKNILTYTIKFQLRHLDSFWNGVWWNLTNGTKSERIGYKYESLRG